MLGPQGGLDQWILSSWLCNSLQNCISENMESDAGSWCALARRPSRCAVKATTFSCLKKKKKSLSFLSGAPASNRNVHDPQPLSHWQGRLEPLPLLRKAVKDITSAFCPEMEQAEVRPHSLKPPLLNLKSKLWYFMHPWNHKKTHWTKFLAAPDRFWVTGHWTGKNNLMTDFLFVCSMLFSVKPGTENFPPDNSYFSLQFLHHLWAVSSGGGGDLGPRRTSLLQTSVFPSVKCKVFTREILLTC